MFCRAPGSPPSGNTKDEVPAPLLFIDREPTMYVQPYLFFDGRCEEAVEFYKKAIGAEVAGRFGVCWMLSAEH